MQDWTAENDSYPPMLSQPPDVQAPTAGQPVVHAPEPVQAPVVQQHFVQAVGGSPDGIGAASTDDGTPSHSLGFALVLVGAGAVMGVVYGGALGAVAGALYGGSAANAVRAAGRAMNGTPDDDKEALVSATYAVLGAGVASYLAYKIVKSGSEDKSDKLVGVK